MTSEPKPEALDVSDSYGLNDPGPDAASLTAIWKRFETERNWWVVSARRSGRPHAAPVWGIVIDEHLYFCSDATAQKTASLRSNPAVVVHLESGDHVAIVEGDVEPLAASELPASFVADYAAKYDIELDLDADGVTYFTVAPTKVMAWEEADFANTAVRYRFS